MDDLEQVEVGSREVGSPVPTHGVLAAGSDRSVRTVFSAASVRFVIDSYAVRVGDRVEAGDVLLTLVSPQADVRVSQEESMLHLLEAQLVDAKCKALIEGDTATDLGVEAAERRLEQSRAALDGLRIGLGRPVRSPIAGIVAELPPVSSESGYAQTVARVVEVDPLRLEVALPLGDAMPRPGTTLEVVVGPRWVEAVVRGIAPVADADGRVLLVLDVANADLGLAAGLHASVTVDVGRWRGLFVPATAVVETAEGPAVWTVTPTGPQIRPVGIVGAVETEVAVLGVREGERVLRSPG